MIELREDQLENMKILRDHHIERHIVLQPIQAIQEFAELQQELTNYIIRTSLGKEVNYLKIFYELFDAYSLLLSMYQIFVIELGQEEMFRLCADKKIQRELKRWIK